MANLTDEEIIEKAKIIVSKQVDNVRTVYSEFETAFEKLKQEINSPIFGGRLPTELNNINNVVNDINIKLQSYKMHQEAMQRIANPGIDNPAI